MPATEDGHVFGAISSDDLPALLATLQLKCNAAMNRWTESSRLGDLQKSMDDWYGYVSARDEYYHMLAKAGRAQQQDSFFRELVAAINQELKKLPKGKRVDPRQLERLLESVTKRIGGRVRQAYRERTRQAYQGGLDEASRDLGLQMEMGAVHEKALMTFLQGAGVAASFSELEDHLTSGFRDIIESAYTTGKVNVGEMTTQMVDVAGHEMRKRLKVIARTETFKVWESARMNAYKEAEIRRGQQFRYRFGTVDDRRTCELCDHIMDRTEPGVTMNQLTDIIQFESTNGKYGNAGWTPTRDGGFPLPHPNCRHRHYRIQDDEVKKEFRESDVKRDQKGRFASTYDIKAARAGVKRLKSYDGDEDLDEDSAYDAVVPFPEATTQPHMDSKKLNDAVYSVEARNAPLQRVRLAELQATQAGVNRQTVIDYIENPSGQDSSSDYPLVYRYDGKYWILDGHHRLTAELMGGQNTAEVRLIDLDKNKKSVRKEWKWVDNTQVSTIPEGAQTRRGPKGGLYYWAGRKNKLPTPDKKEETPAEHVDPDAPWRNNTSDDVATRDRRIEDIRHTNEDLDLRRPLEEIDVKNELPNGFDFDAMPALNFMRSLIDIADRSGLKVINSSFWVSDKGDEYGTPYVEDPDVDSLPNIPQVFIDMKFTDHTGRRVGELTRYVTFKPDGIILYRSYFKLDKQYQGEGISTVMDYETDSFARQIANTHQKPVTIKMAANLDKGGYVWARHGYAPAKSNTDDWDNLSYTVRNRWRKLIVWMHAKGVSMERIARLDDEMSSALDLMGDYEDPAGDPRYGLDLIVDFGRDVQFDYNEVQANSWMSSTPDMAERYVPEEKPDMVHLGKLLLFDTNYDAQLIIEPNEAPDG